MVFWAVVLRALEKGLVSRQAPGLLADWRPFRVWGHTAQHWLNKRNNMTNECWTKDDLIDWRCRPKPYALLFRGIAIPNSSTARPSVPTSSLLRESHLASSRSNVGNLDRLTVIMRAHA